MFSFRTVALLLTTVSLLPVITSASMPSTCSYPYNFSDLEVWGLTSYPNATSSSDACAAACCSASNCDIWQYCEAGNMCGTTQGPACWAGLGTTTLPKSGWVSFSTTPPPSDHTITLTTGPQPMPLPNIPASVSPIGRGTLTIDSLSLRLNGVPILPVAGEMHPSRVPVSQWRSDLLKMRSGGLTMVSAYVMWLHVEEVEGIQDWSGNHNVSEFLNICNDVGLMVALRIGPWDHGECRNGGFPDWVLSTCTADKFKCRANNTGFMNLVHGWYAGLATHVRGQGWSEGGPLVSVQVDNEIDDVDYLLALKDLAIGVGMNPAFWVKTGWPAPSTPVPYASLVPLFGGYTDDFWSKPKDVSYGNFLFSDAPNPAPLPPMTTADEPYPWLTVEMGGGMASSYHRRIHIDGADNVAQAAVYLGSGVASLGFYMYHGGSDPIGSLSTMQESQLTQYPNDMPIRTYDFHAPIGEAGQPRPHYHGLRGLAALTEAWGSWLAPMPSFKPIVRPTGDTDVSTLRIGARSDGQSGLIVINNRAIHLNMSLQSQVRISIIPSEGRAPFTIPLETSQAPSLQPGTWAAYSFGLPLPNDIQVVYALSTPFTMLPESNSTAVFVTSGNIPSEFVFNTSTSLGRPLRFSICGLGGSCGIEDGLLVARHIAPSLNAALTLEFADAAGGVALTILLLDEVSASKAWVTTLAGVRTLFLSDNFTQYVLGGGDVNSNTLELHTENVGLVNSTLWAFPTPGALRLGGMLLPSSLQDGIFTQYSFLVTTGGGVVNPIFSLISEGGPARVIPLGPMGNAFAPSADGVLGEFLNASVYSISLVGVIGNNVDVRLRITYDGDCARLYQGTSVERNDLVMDHFFNG